METGNRWLAELLTNSSEDGVGSGLAEALVVGPIRHIDATEDVAAAERLAADGQPANAADGLLAVADRLLARDLAFAAESLKERAAILRVDLATSSEQQSSRSALSRIASAEENAGPRNRHSRPRNRCLRDTTGLSPRYEPASGGPRWDPLRLSLFALRLRPVTAAEIMNDGLRHTSTCCASSASSAG